MFNEVQDIRGIYLVIFEIYTPPTPNISIFHGLDFARGEMVTEEGDFYQIPLLLQTCDSHTMGLLGGGVSLRNSIWGTFFTVVGGEELPFHKWKCLPATEILHRLPTHVKLKIQY